MTCVGSGYHVNQLTSTVFFIEIALLSLDLTDQNHTVA
jgi:hypothetical protein